MQKISTYLRPLIKHFLRFLTICMVFGSVTVYSQETANEDDKTLSPYFFVMSEDTTLDQLPLKSTSVDVIISGVIADVTVRQMYCNEGEKTLEAIYVFPSSTRAAVYHMQMEIGNRILLAQIKEKEKARQMYEEAKDSGMTVTLLQQERPNVFQMNVANILPDDTIVVEMRYTELLLPEEGKYEFIYPTVVGPRYASPSEDGEEWVASPYQHEGEEPLYNLYISVRINAGMKIKNVQCTSHDMVEFIYENENTAYTSDQLVGNKDYIIEYTLSGAQVESAILLYEGKEENFFLAMIQPPKNPQDYQIPPREYVFIMDVSGSMSGYPIEVSKALLIDLVSSLRPQDKFDMVFFAGGNYVLSPFSLPATQENMNMAIRAIDEQQGGGGTELLPALQTALNLPGTEDFARTFVIATDGYVSVEKETFDLIRENLNEASFFTFGIGTSVNRYIIEGMARVGMGEPFVVTNQEEAYEKADLFRKYIQFPVLTNITVDYNGFEVYDVEPPAVPDVIAERPVTLFGKYTGSAQGTIHIEGLSGSQTFTNNLEVYKYNPDEDNIALMYLWARYKIQLLDDYGLFISEWDSVAFNQHKDQIVELGLKYSLLTQYTSFIAIDSIVRTDPDDTLITVHQPLPLPEGVSNNALPGDSYNYTNSGKFVSNALISSENIIPEKSVIDVVYPNPFHSYTTIKFFIHLDDIEKDKYFEIFNDLGQLVCRMDLTEYGEGFHDLFIDFTEISDSLPAGIYYGRLKIDKAYIGSVRFNYM
jgi:Ca-activated chloride channel family protein